MERKRRGVEEQVVEREREGIHVVEPERRGSIKEEGAEGVPPKS